MAIRIITDACADLPKAWSAEMGVQVLPLTVNMEERSFQYNGVDKYENDMTLDEFYAAVREGKMPSTAQATPESFKELFLEALNVGDEVLYLAFSSAMSGCYNSSCIAKNEIVEDMPEAADKIALVDTLCASLGQTMLISLVHKEMQKGVSLQQLAAYAESMKLRMQHWVAVDDLNHLRRGGRVSGASAFIGTLLSIKPVIQLTAEGKLVPMEKVQGRQKSMRAIVDKMLLDCVDDPESPVYIVHGDCIKDAETVKKLVAQKAGKQVTLINCLGPVIGAHAGPGTVAVFYVAKQDR